MKPAGICRRVMSGKSRRRGAQQLSITVVPGSGTGALSGISGTFRLDIVEGKHFYEFEYSLPQ